jgi:hypothetical protein
LCQRAFRLKITDMGKLIASQTSIYPGWETVKSFLSDWITLFGAVDIKGNFKEDGSFSQPIVTTKKVTWSLTYSAEGHQQVSIPGFPPLDIVKSRDSKGNMNPTSAITLLIPPIILTQMESTV